MLMATKLTLRLDERLIRRAKAHARRTGKSVSQVVAEYFALLSDGESAAVPIAPTVSRLRGVLAGGDASCDGYHEYLERKYS
jgi:hypothetical protein